MGDAATVDPELSRLFHDRRHDRQGVASLWTLQKKRPDDTEELQGRLAWKDAEILEVPGAAGNGPTPIADGHTDVETQTTQVVLTKTMKGYELTIDGVKMDLSGDKRKFEITRFRGPFRVPDTDKVVIGPVTIALVTDTGVPPPAAATINLVQKSVSTTGAKPREDVLQTMDLPVSNVQDPTFNAVGVPFPCRFTESPYIIIDDVYNVRLHQAKKSFFKFGTVVRYFMYVAAGMGLAALGAPSSTFKDLLKEGLRNAPNGYLWDAIFRYRSGASETVLDDTAKAAVAAYAMGFVFQVLSYTRMAALSTPEDYELVQVALGEKTYEPGEGPADQSTEMDKARSTALKKIVDSFGKETVPDPARKKRKFTLRGLAQTLESLMAINDAAEKETNRVIRMRYKNEAVLADYLMEPERSEKFEYLENHTIAKLIRTRDEKGQLPKGLVFAQVGSADVSGLDIQLLRQCYVTTAIDIQIVDHPGAPGTGLRVRLEAEAETAFQAGFHASGVHRDMERLEDTLIKFETVHCDKKDDKKLRSDDYTNYEWFYRLFKTDRTDPGWREKAASIRRITRRQICNGVDKLRNTLLKGTKTDYARKYGLLNVMKIPPPQKSVDAQLSLTALRRLHRQKPIETTPALADGSVLALCTLGQRVSYVSLPIPSFTNASQLGIVTISAENDQVQSKLAIEAAIEEAMRYGNAYGRAIRALVQLWESRTRTRAMLYRAFTVKKTYAEDELKLGAPLGQVGWNRPAFTSDAMLFPMEIRDELTRWSTSTDPALADGVDRISTYDPPTDAAEARDLSELVAYHVVADMLIARLLVRSRESTERMCVVGALRSLRARLRDVVALNGLVARAAQEGLSGVLARNDPLFVCLPGGVDTARVLHCAGAWRRRADTALPFGGAGTIGLQIDNTLGQRLASHNRWPNEAHLQLKRITASLRRVSEQSFATAPIYALQNTLAVADAEQGLRSSVLKARLLEALASFQRTDELAQTFDAFVGEAGAGVRTGVALRLVMHWPVLIAARLASSTDDQFVRYIAGLDAERRASQKHTTPLRIVDPTSDDARNAHRKAIVEAMQLRNATLRIDLHRLYDDDRTLVVSDPSASRDDGTEADASATERVPGKKVALELAEKLSELVSRDSKLKLSVTMDGYAASYFVPFAHGVEPLNRVRSLVHPGARGLDSVPVWIDQLHAATLRARAALAPTETPTLTIQPHGDASVHPFQIGIVDKRNVQCRLVASAFAVTGVSGKMLEEMNAAKAANRLLRDSEHLPRGSLIDIIGWNTERLVQASLLAMGHGLLVPGAYVECGYPNGPTLYDPLHELPDDERDRSRANRKLLAMQRLRGAAVAHVRALESAYAYAMGPSIDETVRRLTTDDPAARAAESARQPPVNIPPAATLTGLTASTGAGPSDGVAASASVDPPADSEVERKQRRENIKNWIKKEPTKKVNWWSVWSRVKNHEADEEFKTDDDVKAYARLYAQYTDLAFEMALEDRYEKIQKVLDDTVRGGGKPAAGLILIPYSVEDNRQDVNAEFGKELATSERAVKLREAADELSIAAEEHAQTALRRKRSDAALDDEVRELKMEHVAVARQSTACFLASVVLADAVLSSLFGTALAPRLRVRRAAAASADGVGSSTEPPRSATAPRRHAVSLFEAAVLLNELVRADRI